MRWTLAGVAALTALSIAPGTAQTLVHRYSFNGNANDSVGSANGTVVGNVAFQTDPTGGANGEADFSGGTSQTNPGYIRLPTSSVSGLQNATIEIFTTNFDSTHGAFQALFAIASPLNNLTNYTLLAANRVGTGIGTGARNNNGTEDVIAAPDPLPDGYENHIIDLVYSGYSGIGTVGTESLYFDGTLAAQGKTKFSFADVAAGSGGIATVGIGGGSPFNDPTFAGGMNEFRIYNGALTADQINMNINAGPGVVAVNVAPGTPAPSSAFVFAFGLFGTGFALARKRSARTLPQT